MAPDQPPRRLMLIGGAEDRTGEARILREFVTLAGGHHARIVVLTVASRRPEEVGAAYIGAFRRLGATQALSLHVDYREDSNDDDAVALIEGATGAFFTGGDQMRITSLLGGSRLEATLHRGLGSGLVIGGTSAGAAIMPGTMIVTGRGQACPSIEIVDLSPGMGFLPGTLVDQHFAQRGRIGRLLTAVAHHPRFLGLGIDENTAVVVEGDRFHVLGNGSVTVIDAQAMTYTNLCVGGAERNLALCGITLHVLPDGYRFSLTDRQPEIPHRVTAGRPSATAHRDPGHDRRASGNRRPAQEA